MTKLENLVEMKNKLESDGKGALIEAFDEFFKAHPEAKAIVWTQYTPYFNDGDACVFGINDFELKASLAEDVRDLLDEDYEYGSNCAARILSHLQDRSLTEAERSLVEDFEKLERSCAEIRWVLQLVLGDHVKVVATPSGFEIMDHDHS